MAKSRRVASLILLAALDFKEGNRDAARAHLEKAAEDEDFGETIDGMQSDMDEDEDPFMKGSNPEEASDDDDDDGTGGLAGMGDLLDDTEENAGFEGNSGEEGDQDDDADDVDGLESLLDKDIDEDGDVAGSEEKATIGRRPPKSKKPVRAKVGGNDTHEGAEPDNNSDEDMRQEIPYNGDSDNENEATLRAETARLKQVRKNLRLMAAAG